MLTNVVWWAGNILEAVLVGRALWAKLFRRYPFFYSYVSYVLLQSLSRFYIHGSRPALYPKFYWSTEFLALIVGCGVLWEIYKHALSPFPGAGRVARNVLLLILAMIVAKVMANASNGPRWWPIGNTAEMERDLRLIQAILLIALVSVLMHYAVSLGRNLKGLILGYGLFLATSVIHLAFRAWLPDWFQRWWVYIQPMAYLPVLAIWCVALWSYEPIPMPHAETQVNREYDQLVTTTKKHLAQARTYVRRAIGS
jgi:hypothetical protein